MMPSSNARFTYEYEVFNPAFTHFDNEALYDALCAATVPLNEGLWELANRMRPITMGLARDFLNVLSWTFDDAKGDALILIWELVERRSYKDGAPFHAFFSRCYQLRLNNMFKRTVMKNPVLLGNCTIGMAKETPIKVCGYGWHEKAESYRQKELEQGARKRAKKRAELNLPPKKPPMTDEERREKARQYSAGRFAAMTPEEKRAKYDKENAARRAKRAAETPEERAARNARYAAYARARRARQAAQATA